MKCIRGLRLRDQIRVESIQGGYPEVLAAVASP